MEYDPFAESSMCEYIIIANRDSYNKVIYFGNIKYLPVAFYGNNHLFRLGDMHGYPF